MSDAPLTEQQRTMVAEAVPFAKWYVRKVPRHERPEALAICLMALVEAAQSWDPGRGVKFTSYSSKCMRNALVAAYRKRVRDAAAALRDDEAVDPYDPQLDRAIRWLRTRGMQVAAKDQVDLAILELHFLEGTREAMGRWCGYSASGAWVRRADLFKRLRRQAEADGEIF